MISLIPLTIVNFVFDSENRKYPQAKNFTVFNLVNTRLTVGNFPGGPVVKNPPSNAGDVGSIPDRGTKIPHAAGQLSPRATTTELRASREPTCRKIQSPRALEPMYHN